MCIKKRSKKYQQIIKHHSKIAPKLPSGGLWEPPWTPLDLKAFPRPHFNDLELIWGSILDPKSDTKSNIFLCVFLRCSPESFLGASGLNFESFWAPFWRLFRARVETRNLCSRKGGSSLDRVPTGQICDLFPHSSQDLSRESLWKRFLTILS